ncbi:hypothetical protein GOV13_01830 [Candidatus Pacearchaeota archaeon]|nr:hypothetical protein [Candidatus Pacearchaeota archaeon]
MDKRGKIALSQIIILIVGVVAISYAIGSGTGVVSSFVPICLPDMGSSALPCQDMLTGDTLNTLGPVPGPKSITTIPGRGYDWRGDGNIFGKDKSPVKSDAALSQWLGISKGSGYDAIFTGVQWAFVTYGIIHTLGGMVGLSADTTTALANAAMAGAFAQQGLSTALTDGGVWAKGDFVKWLGSGDFKISGQAFANAAGLALTVIIFVLTYKDESTETVTFDCDVWEAPIGGANCDKCNKQVGELGCSEYQCRSLGQACQLLNPGTTEEKCAWINRQDVKFPIIQPWEAALLEDYVYTPDGTINPPDRGVKVLHESSTTGCVKAFTPLTFGIFLDEPAQCKIDYERQTSFEEMSHTFGGSNLHRYNHTQVMSLPGADNLAAENLTLQNNGNYELYVRCQDANGNFNTANFVFKFCVEEGPDTTPPLIVTTKLLNDMPVAYNQSEIDQEVYTNEPADCKWSKLDKSYDDMENDMTCSSSIMNMNAQMLYPCSTELIGIKNNQDNDFYFRCKDKPLGEEDRNVNAESYKFTLIGTMPLVISEVGPNETVKDSTETVKVTLEAETNGGYKEGEATCEYSDTGDDDDYVMFFYESGQDNLNHKHTQDLYLPEEDYEYFIKCYDLGGNTDIKSTSFLVESDSEAPLIVRAYHEENYLKLITDEEAECVYDSLNCNYLFDDGIKLTEVDETNHFTDWDTSINFYVKCRDIYGNEPSPDACSMVVRPFEI